MLRQPSTLSLFQLLHQRLEQRLPTVRCTRTTLLHLSNTLEELIRSHRIPAFLFTGFQTPQTARQEIDRYQTLAQVVQQIFIFAESAEPEPAPNLLYIPIGNLGPLSQEWFVLILAESFSVILCGHEHQISEAPKMIGQFDILWSFEPEIINSALDSLAEVIGLHSPEQLSHLQVARSKFSLSNPDATIVTQFTMELFRFEEKLKETQQDSWIENVSDAIISTDLNFHVQSWNKAAETIYGWSADETIGKLLSDMIPTRYSDDQIEAIRKVFSQEGHWEGEVIQRRKDGTPVHIHNSGTLLKDSTGQPVGAVAINRDITARKQAEEAFRKTQKALQELINSIDGIVWEADANTFQFSFVSFQAERLLGFPVEQWLNEPDFWMNHTYEGDREWAVGYCVQCTQDLKNHELEYRMVAADGRQVWLRDIITVIVEDNRAVKIRGVMVDITERKRLEEQLRQSQKLEAIGRLAGGVAHDFNNLLTVINGYSDLLLNILSDNDPSRRDLEQIKKAGERAASLTMQLLAFSRQQILQPQILDINLIVIDMDRILRRLIGEHIELVAKPQPGLERIKADPNQLEQVIMNLAVNARDAMPHGGELTIETANVTLDENYTQQHVNVTPGPHVMLAISDTGSGMDAQTIAHIFEPFFTTKEVGKGTGLGLATVYGIVTQSGGHLQVHSEIDHGTTFKIYFPIIKETAKASDQGIKQDHGSDGLETILLVEDDPSVRALIHSVLEKSDYTVLEAGNGLEALEVSRKYPDTVDLLLTDVVMPKMGGRELAKNLASLHPAIKVLYISGYTHDTMLSHGIFDLKTAFLHKPFTPEELIRKVREVLDTERMVGSRSFS